MKILHVSKKYPRALGGDAVVVSHLQQQQQRAGHNVVILTSNCDEIADGSHIYKLGLKDTPAGLDAITFKRLVSLLILCARMFTLLPKERPDVIHTHSIDMAFFASFAARLYRIPMVHTFHIVTFYNPDQSALRRKTEVWFAKSAGLQYATAPNAYDVKKLQDAGLAQTMLLPNGVDTAFWKAQSHTKQSRVFTFLAIGRLEPQKGYEYLIKAASLLTAMSPTAFRVIIAGDGSQGAALRRLTHDLHLDAIVSFVGHKTPQEINALLSEADAVALPSLYETTPIALLEAWSAGLPVIASSVGILRDMPEGFNAAYIVPPKDDQSLMLAMNQCMTNPESRATIAANGYAEAQKYTWPLVAQTAELIYRSVI